MFLNGRIYQLAHHEDIMGDIMLRFVRPIIFALFKYFITAGKLQLLLARPLLKHYLPLING